MAFGDRKLTAFHTKARKPLKRTPLKRPTAKKTVKKKTPRRKTITDKVWELCKQITRGRYGNVCYTCGAHDLEGKNWHTGHGKPNGALPLRYKYDLRNLRPQCYHCNIDLGGCSDIFIAKLERESEGLEFLLEACEKTDGVWRIKQGNTMGGKDGTLFLLALTEQYRHEKSTL